MKNQERIIKGQDTLLSYLILKEEDVEEFLDLIDAIADTEERLKNYRKEADIKKITLFENDLLDLKDEHNNMLDAWINAHPEADMKMEIKAVRKWYQEKEDMINEFV